MQFISVKNINDVEIKQCFKLLYDLLENFFQSNRSVYTMVIKTCFETSENKLDESIQLTNLQNLFLKDYMRFYIRTKEFLLSNDIDLIYKKLHMLSKFVINNKTMHVLFGEILLILKERNDSFNKKIRQLLLSLFQLIENKDCSDLRYAIIYYFMHCKIEKAKRKIEKIKTVSNSTQIDPFSDMHIVFSFLNKSVKKLCFEMKDENDLSMLFETFDEGTNQLSVVNLNINDDELLSIENQLKTIESAFNTKCFLIQDNDLNLKTTTLSTDLLNEEPNPFILYRYYNSVNDIHETIKFSKRNYVLKGYVFLSHNVEDKKIIVINKHNSYLYSVFDDKWDHSLEKLVDRNSINKIIGVYFLIKDQKSKVEITFSDLQNDKTSFLFVKHMKKEMEWLLNNALWELIQYLKYFAQMFDFRNVNIYNEILKIGVNWEEKEFVKLKEKIHKMSKLGSVEIL